MNNSERQKFIDVMFEIAMLSAKYMHGKSNEEIAKWVSDQLHTLGYPTTPVGASWGILNDR